MQRVIIIGMGKMGLVHGSIMNILPDAEVVALCDLDKSLGNYVKSIGLNAPFYPTLDEALKEVQADSVLVTTPQFSHRVVAEAAIKHNLHVFIEKPSAHTLEDAQALYDLVKGRSEIVHAVGYMKAHYPLYQEMGRLIQDGVLGTVKNFRASLYLSQVFAPKSGWMFTQKQAGGGLLTNTACHLLYLLYAWFGELAGVYAKTVSLHSKEVEDTASAVMEFRNGVVGTLHSSWSVPGFQVEETEVLIEGTNGILIADDNRYRLHLIKPHGAYPQGWTVRHRSETDAVSFNLSPEYGGEGYYNEDLNFIQCCRDGKPALVTWYDGLQVQKMMDAIYRSSREGYITLTSSSE